VERAGQLAVDVGFLFIFLTVGTEFARKTVVVVCLIGTPFQELFQPDGHH